MTLFEVVTAAVNDLSENGYTTPQQLIYWIARIRKAAEESLIPAHELADLLNRTLGATYKRMVDNGSILTQHPGVSRFTLEKVRPQLRAELNRRIMASADLIKLNREAAIEKTVQRFSGWASSIPTGGSDVVAKNAVKAQVRKSMTQLPFEERRVLIDQGHKFTANLSDIIATDGGALAGCWHSNFRQPGYNYRKDHKERDGRYWCVPGNWALNAGLMKKGPNGYTSDITMPAEEPFCRCKYRYVYTLRGLPEEMLTAKGKAELQRVRAEIAKRAA